MLFQPGQNTRRENERGRMKHVTAQGKELPQQFCQILRLQMRVPFQHLQGLVTCDRSHLHRIQSLLEESRCRLVPEVVEGQIDQERGIGATPFFLAFRFVEFSGPDNGTGKGLGNRGGFNVPDSSINPAGKAR